MSAAIIANNTTMKISTVVAVSGNITNGAPANLYTVPANSYAIVNVSLGSASTGTCTLRIKTAGTQKINLLELTAGQSDSKFGVYLGPGDIIEKVATGTVNTCTYAITGVEFINTP